MGLSRKRRTYKRFTLEDRKVIAACLQKGLSIRKIAEKLDRSASSISREINRNIGYYQPCTSYSPKQSHEKADYNRIFTKLGKNKLIKDHELGGYVLSGILNHKSPGTISKDVKTNLNKSVSRQTIYKFMKIVKSRLALIFDLEIEDLREMLLKCKNRIGISDLNKPEEFSYLVALVRQTIFTGSGGGPLTFNDYILGRDVFELFASPFNYPSQQVEEMLPVAAKKDQEVDCDIIPVEVNPLIQDEKLGAQFLHELRRFNVKEKSKDCDPFPNHFKAIIDKPIEDKTLMDFGCFILARLYLMYGLEESVLSQALLKSEEIVETDLTKFENCLSLLQYMKSILYFSPHGLPTIYDHYELRDLFHGFLGVDIGVPHVALVAESRQRSTHNKNSSLFDYNREDFIPVIKA